MVTISDAVPLALFVVWLALRGVTSAFGAPSPTASRSPVVVTVQAADLTDAGRVKFRRLGIDAIAFTVGAADAPAAKTNPATATQKE